MNESAFSSITERVRRFIALPARDNCEGEFNALALDLFRLQFENVLLYRKFCERSGILPSTVESWRDIPGLPISAFKQFEITSLERSRRRHVFESSGTTAERHSHNYHDPESLALYESSVLAGFQSRVHADFPRRLVFLTPPGEAAPHSSLVHMFETLRREGNDRALPFNVGMASPFHGRVDSSGNWQVRVEDLVTSAEMGAAVMMMGTAFNFVHLLDHLAEKNRRLKLRTGSIVLETGGYKGRSRSMPKPALYRLIEEYLDVSLSHIISEYGMCELGSQAYDNAAAVLEQRRFRFPPWVRTRIVSPETHAEVSIGEAGLLQVFDLANVRSVLAIQTEDLATSTGEGFQLLGRASDVEPRGCSLMTV